MSLLYYPDESAELLHVHAEHLADENVVGVDLGFTELQGHLLPIMDADLCFIIARPGNAKTSLLAHISRIAAQLALHDPTYGPPIFISNEMPIEELQLRQLAFYSNIDSKQIRFGKSSNDWDQLHRDIDEMLIEYPITYIGASLYDRSTSRRLTIEAIKENIDAAIQKTGKRPRIVCLDYLQRTTTEQYYRDRRLALGEVVETCKDIASDYATPIVVGSQASREVDTEKFPVPEMRHGKETGSIEEAGDWVISGMRPIKYYPLGEPIPYSDKNMIVTEDLYYIKILKQRNGDSGNGAWIKFDPRISAFDNLHITY